MKPYNQFHLLFYSYKDTFVSLYEIYISMLECLNQYVNEKYDA